MIYSRTICQRCVFGVSSFVQQIKHILYSIRPSAGLMAAALAVVSYRPAPEEAEIAAWLSLYFFCGSAYCFLINDLFDREKDLANNKTRPIATGQLTIKNVWLSLVFSGIAFLIFGYLIRIEFFFLGIGAIVSFSLYPLINNKTGLPANILVAIWATAPVWEMMVLRPVEAAFFYWVSQGLFVFLIIREVLLDWLDVDGDLYVGKTSLPIQLKAPHLLQLLLALMFLTTGFFISFGMLVSVSMVSWVLLSVSAIIIWPLLLRLKKHPTRKNVLYIVRFSHLSFVLFALALLLR